MPAPAALLVISTAAAGLCCGLFLHNETALNHVKKRENLGDLSTPLPHPYPAGVCAAISENGAATTHCGRSWRQSPLLFAI